MSSLYMSADSDACRTTHTMWGHKRITAHVRGFSAGVETSARFNPDKGESIAVYMTGGSRGSASPVHIGTVHVDANGEPLFVPAGRSDA